MQLVFLVSKSQQTNMYYQLYLALVYFFAGHRVRFYFRIDDFWMEISYADESDSSNRPVNAAQQQTPNHKCSKCSKTFSTNQAFLYHSRYGATCGRFSKKYQCRKCSDWKGSTFNDIETHLRLVHDSDTTAQNLSKFSKIALEYGRFTDFGSQGLPTPATQGLCAFNKGWSMVVKSMCQKFGDCLCDGIRPMKVGCKNRYFRSNNATQGVAKLLTRDCMDGRRSIKSKTSLNLSDAGGYEMRNFQPPHFQF